MNIVKDKLYKKDTLIKAICFILPDMCRLELDEFEALIPDILRLAAWEIFTSKWDSTCFETNMAIVIIKKASIAYCKNESMVYGDLEFNFESKARFSREIED